MYTFRLYTSFIPETEFTLTPDLSHRVLNVLRLKPNDPLVLFDGREKEYAARIITVDKKKQVIVRVTPSSGAPEPPISIHLAQGISRGEKMDYTIQKSVELGVKKITPLFTKRGEVKLSGERLQKRLAHWEAIVISACEQSGRVFLPSIEPPPHSFSDWLREMQTKCPSPMKFILDPRAQENLSKFLSKRAMLDQAPNSSSPLGCGDPGDTDVVAKERSDCGDPGFDFPWIPAEFIPAQAGAGMTRGDDDLLQDNSVLVLIGPESGFTEEEIESAKICGFHPVRLGPRVLRTETAGPAVVAILQSYLGDMS